MCLTAIQKKLLCVVTMLSKVIEAGSVDYVKLLFIFWHNSLQLSASAETLIAANNILFHFC